jgi:hypothetical protein
MRYVTGWSPCCSTRKMVSSERYHVPMPRKFAAALPTNVHANDEAVAKVFMLN